MALSRVLLNGPRDEAAIELDTSHMQRQLLFVQGGGAGVHDEWDARLVDSLTGELGPQYEVRYPRMPDEHDPSFAGWSVALHEQLDALGDGAVVVGHSIGATMLIHALAERPPSARLGGVFLLSAPFVGDGGWQSDEWRPSADFGARLPGDVPIHLYYGLADDTVPASHAELYAAALPQARVHRLPGRDHQLNDDLREVAEAIRRLSPAG